MLTVEIRSRIEPALKDEATAVLRASGLDVSTAIRLFMRSVVEKGCFPIDMPKPNAQTLAAIADAKKGRATRTSLDAL
jgi:DNA-damage-inducible protein J